jgi:hypothetical protein
VRLKGDIKRLWFLQTVPPLLPNQGIADTLEEAKAAPFTSVNGPWQWGRQQTRRIV